MIGSLRAYVEVNLAFGDIVKVTPASKVVGDMALMMVTSNTTVDDVVNPDVEIAFPDSVVSLFAGELGQPTGGFPPELQKKVLRNRNPVMVRPGSLLEPTDLDAERRALQEDHELPNSDTDLASHLMYPTVFADYRRHLEEFGPDLGC